MRRVRLPGGRRSAIIGVAALILLGGAFAGGYFVGDDSAEVDRLSSELSETERDLHQAERDRDQAQAALADAEEAGERLADRLEAELSIEGIGRTGRGEEAEEIDADFEFGAAGKLGDLVVRPTSLDRRGNSWVLTLEAKNDGDQSVGIWCGGLSDLMLDEQGREFDGDSVLASDSANCGDDLQPGLTATYKIGFKSPDDAVPLAFALAPSDSYSGLDPEPATWAAP